MNQDHDSAALPFRETRESEPGLRSHDRGAGTIMTPDRRQVLCLAAAAGAVVRAPHVALAAETGPRLELDAQAIKAGDTGPARLGYRTAPEVPVTRVPKDASLRVILRNTLSETTGIDWHGLRRDTAPDPEEAALAPGRTATFALKAVESGTSWFHAPAVPGRSDQTARGLAGVLVVEETSPPPADDDVILFLADRLDAAGARLKDQLSVNRKAWPERKTYAPGSRIRLRLVNGSTRHALTATFESGRVAVIAIDGQPSELFRPLNDTLPVGPGARFDVMIDLAETGGAEFKVALRGAGEPAASEADPVFVVQLDGPRKPGRAPVAALSPNPRLPPAIALEKATRFELTATRSPGAKAPAAFAINGSSSVDLPLMPLFKAKRNAAVTIGFFNRTTDLIGFRLQGQAMRLLHALDDGWEPYWRDSVLVPPGKTVRVAFQAATPGRWLIESPFFDQATTGLRRWFEVS